MTKEPVDRGNVFGFVVVGDGEKGGHLNLPAAGMEGIETFSGRWRLPEMSDLAEGLEVGGRRAVGRELGNWHIHDERVLRIGVMAKSDDRLRFDQGEEFDGYFEGAIPGRDEMKGCVAECIRTDAFRVGYGQENAQWLVWDGCGMVVLLRGG